MYLLDTCAFIWYLGDNPKLPEKIKDIIEEGRGVFLSLATLWEIAIKKTIGRLDIPENTFELEKKCKDEDINIIPINSKYFETIQTLPLHHGDPFDRLIMATAIEENLTLITSDSKITQYKEVNCIWQ